ncbi:MAG: dTMP kinase [Verrucomicrobia bacterium]|nr:dTMP kinase [Verrucomicrobiota bacterium]MDE3048100.1 dTMP kinase [Verrucomicrobiota bacterium]
MRGKFITFEGGEGAGKTTLIEEIARQLTQEGRPVLKTREPGGTKLGEQIRTMLLQHTGPVSPYAEFSLFLASRAQHILEVIGPALESGKIVLCDRFNDSSIAYQGAARGLGMEQVGAFCKFISQGLEPELTLYLDLDPRVGLLRAAKDRKQDRIEAETIAFHEKIREAFLAIHKADPRRVCLIDASMPFPKVFEEAMKRIAQHV